MPKKRKKKLKDKLPKLTKRNTYILIAVIIVIAIAIGGLSFTFSTLQPSPAGTSGWVTFSIKDQETGDNLEGTILLIPYDEQDSLLSTGDDYSGENPIATGEVTYLPEPVIAIVKNVTLKNQTSRTWLPASISPLGSENQNEPRQNTIWLKFLHNKDNVSTKITKLNGEEGTFDHSDIAGDTEHNLTIQFNITSNFETMFYGSHGYVPPYLLEDYPISHEYNVTGFGLWLCFNGTDIRETSVYVNDIVSSSYYVNATNDFSMILLDPILCVGQNTTESQEVVFELTDNPTGMFVFEGFLENMDETKLIIS